MGPEDLVTYRSGNERTALLTGTANRTLAGVFKKREGRLEIAQQGDEKFCAVVCSLSNGQPFHPVGIYVVDRYQGPDRRFAGHQLAFVINSPGGKTAARTERFPTIEVFDIDGDDFEHVATISSEFALPNGGGKRTALSKPNSIAVDSNGHVIVSNYGGLKIFGKDDPVTVAADAGRLPADFAKVKTHTVVCFDPGKTLGEGSWRMLVTGAHGPNGLSFSSDEKTLLMCSYFSHKVWSFSWTPQRELADRREVARLEFGTDNLHRFGDNQWTVTGQTSLLGTALHLCLPRLVRSSGGYSVLSIGGDSEPPMIPLPGVNAPATTVPLGGKVYTGGIIREDIFVFDEQ